MTPTILKIIQCTPRVPDSDTDTQTETVRLTGDCHDGNKRICPVTFFSPTGEREISPRGVNDSDSIFGFYRLIREKWTRGTATATATVTASHEAEAEAGHTKTVEERGATWTP